MAEALKQVREPPRERERARRRKPRSEGDERTRALLRESKLLAGLDGDRRDALLELASIVEIPEPGVVIVREGAASENFYWILEGEAEVAKRDEHDDEREFIVAELGPGDHFGETSLFESGTRTATIRSKTPLRLGMIRARPVREAPGEHDWLAMFLFNLVQHDSRRIARLTSATIDGRRLERDHAARLISLPRVLLFAILGVTLYGLGLATVLEVLEPGIVRGTLLASLSLGLLAAIYKAIETGPYPWSFFGLALPDRRGRALGETALLTATGVAALSVLALAIDRATGAGLPLLEPPGDSFVGAVVLLGVIVFAGLEELCVRGVLQTTLTEVFRDQDERLLYAIVLSNALFALAHTAISANFALLQFGLGLVWGFAYSRQRSLVGVVVARVIVVFFALRMLHLHELVAAGV